MKNWMLKAGLWMAIAAGVCATEQTARAKGQAEHVVVVVWDGMRPDFVTPQFTPTLYWLATNGVFFRNNLCAYISSTEVNGTVLATGVHPNRSGIMANVHYQPELDWDAGFGTEVLDPIRRGDLITDGHYLMTPTLAETLHAAGIPTIIAGAKPVVLLHDRHWKRPNPAAVDSPVLFAGKTMPRALAEALKKANHDKDFPGTVTHPNTGQDTWTTTALTKVLWKDKIPKFTLLWLSEPDKSQHETGVGSDKSIDALEGSDHRLREVIKTLQDKKVWDKTDLFVVSDHGFSTINRGPDLVKYLNRQGFNATKKLDNPEPGDLLVVGLGGSASLYVMDGEESVIRRLVESLQTSDYAGVIFSRLEIEGTFPLSQAEIGTTNHAPDIVVALRWSADKNTVGAPGLLTAMDGGVGKGTHASLSRFDMNNTLIAAGPDFKKGFISRTPSGNIDLVPTVLWVLGVDPKLPLDGRVLHEGITGSKEPVPEPVEKTIEATRDLGFFRWRQYLKFTRMGKTTYFNEGNGEVVLK